MSLNVTYLHLLFQMNLCYDKLHSESQVTISSFFFDPKFPVIHLLNLNCHPHYDKVIESERAAWMIALTEVITPLLLKDAEMIHYSCDRCKTPIDSESDIRYVVNLEVQAVMETEEFDDLDDDRDHLMEIDELLEHLGDVDPDQIGDEYQKRRYDLCSSCYQQFMKNPVGGENPSRLDFSQN